MKDLSIDIELGGKNYPLHIKEDEKDAVLNAAQKINETYSLLSTKYAVKDTKDLMAMTALKLVSELLTKPSKEDSENSNELLIEINSRLENLLS